MKEDTVLGKGVKSSFVIAPIDKWLSTEKGWLQVRNSYKITPRAQISTLESGFFRLRTSGAMYAIVPTIVVYVSFIVWRSAALDIPKSPIFRI
jgi:hypothetical protein